MNPSWNDIAGEVTVFRDHYLMWILLIDFHKKHTYNTLSGAQLAGKPFQITYEFYQYFSELEMLLEPIDYSMGHAAKFPVRKYQAFLLLHSFEIIHQQTEFFLRYIEETYATEKGQELLHRICRKPIIDIDLIRSLFFSIHMVAAGDLSAEKYDAYMSYLSDYVNQKYPDETFVPSKKRLFVVNKYDTAYTELNHEQPWMS